MLKRGLMLWGALSLVVVIGFYAMLAYQLGRSPHGNVDADDRDVRFVLDWFGSDRDVELKQSYRSSGSWSGDYTKAFALKLGEIDESEIARRGGVTRGDRLSPVIQGAVGFVTDFIDSESVPWFPRKSGVLTREFYVYPVRMEHIGSYPDSVHIMLIHPTDGLVFYAAVKI
ncbi:MAG: hypothetical protein DWQ08_01980 [Proteobacteria bacterium]|nr:MAG: hypothetical protein DWQ08_01980 [Pseudomonadota bacterium]